MDKLQTQVLGTVCPQFPLFRRLDNFGAVKFSDTPTYTVVLRFTQHSKIMLTSFMGRVYTSRYDEHKEVQKNRLIICVSKWIFGRDREDVFSDPLFVGKKVVRHTGHFKV